MYLTSTFFKRHCRISGISTSLSYRLLNITIIETDLLRLVLRKLKIFSTILFLPERIDLTQFSGLVPMLFLTGKPLKVWGEYILQILKIFGLLTLCTRRDGVQYSFLRY